MSKFLIGDYSTEKLQGVHPDLAFLFSKVLERSTIDFTIVSGRRSMKEQHHLLTKGGENGQKVTETINSRHLGGLAIDFNFSQSMQDELISRDPDIKDYDDAQAYFAKQVGPIFLEVAREYGIPIEWGGQWPNLKDYLHVEMDRTVYEQPQEVVEAVQRYRDSDGKDLSGPNLKDIQFTWTNQITGESINQTQVNLPGFVQLHNNLAEGNFDNNLQRTTLVSPSVAPKSATKTANTPTPTKADAQKERTDRANLYWTSLERVGQESDEYDANIPVEYREKLRPYLIDIAERLSTVGEDPSTYLSKKGLDKVNAYLFAAQATAMRDKKDVKEVILTDLYSNYGEDILPILELNDNNVLSVLAQVVHVGEGYSNLSNSISDDDPREHIIADNLLKSVTPNATRQDFENYQEREGKSLNTPEDGFTVPVKPFGIKSHEWKLRVGTIELIRNGFPAKSVTVYDRVTEFDEAVTKIVRSAQQKAQQDGTSTTTTPTEGATTKIQRATTTTPESTPTKAQVTKVLVDAMETTAKPQNGIPLPASGGYDFFDDVRGMFTTDEVQDVLARAIIGTGEHLYNYFVPNGLSKSGSSNSTSTSSGAGATATIQRQGQAQGDSITSSTIATATAKNNTQHRIEKVVQPSSRPTDGSWLLTQGLVATFRAGIRKLDHLIHGKPVNLTTITHPEPAQPIDAGPRPPATDYFPTSPQQQIDSSSLLASLGRAK